MLLKWQKIDNLVLPLRHFATNRVDHAAHCYALPSERNSCWADHQPDQSCPGRVETLPGYVSFDQIGHGTCDPHYYCGCCVVSHSAVRTDCMIAWVSDDHPVCMHPDHKNCDYGCRRWVHPCLVAAQHFEHDLRLIFQKNQAVVRGLAGICVGIVAARQKWVV